MSLIRRLQELECTKEQHLATECRLLADVYLRDFLITKEVYDLTIKRIAEIMEGKDDGNSTRK